MNEFKDLGQNNSAKSHDFQGRSLFKKSWSFAKLAIKGKESISSLSLIGYVSYFIFFAIIDLNFLRKIHLQSTIKIFCFFGIIFFVWHLISVRRCTPKEKKLSKEEKKQLQIQQNQDRSKKFIRKLLLKEAIFNIKTSTFLTVIDIYFIISCLQRIQLNLF